MREIVIKCGGSSLEELPEEFFVDLVHSHEQGVCSPVIVHGGGPLISKLLEQTGVKTEFVNGLRKTTGDVLKVVEMVLSGSVNKQLVNRIQLAGGNAFGLSGADGYFMAAEPAGNSLGFVGEICKVDTEVVRGILSRGQIPVISPVSADPSTGQKYNINGDTAAAAVAEALGAPLSFISDIPGIYRSGGGGWFEHLTVPEAESLLEKKEVTGGMVPKLKAAVEGLKSGVPEVSVINGLDSSALRALLQNTQIPGTRITAGEVTARV
ncbi:acetylglutamate kinase [Alteribacter natronophilus]|uniref:acetylglutamate kinase n=1 Tax=Alteribacter natronophilus TaxID=2583810 RepID=UPI00110D96F8|nr:acetylglutamate kinase [Alteribacter natronophilus]TMW72497.1 acetylglutamate kinase [Alteribacter natronophilus]